MKKFKGTKGVWEYETTNSKFETEITCGKKRIAEVKHYNVGENDWTKNDPKYNEGVSNAKLITASPIMLSTLIEISKGKGTIEGIAELAKIAIDEAL